MKLLSRLLESVSKYQIAQIPSFDDQLPTWPVASDNQTIYASTTDLIMFSQLKHSFYALVL